MGPLRQRPLLGRPCARTTAPTATPGCTSRTTWPGVKAYRWGEDGIAGLCDRYQVLVFAPAFWNGRDPILKERLFGLNSPEGNHGEDVKEYYYYLDNVPSHAYMRFLYKYPQAEFPYLWLVEENRRRTTLEPEFELIDTGIFEAGSLLRHRGRVCQGDDRGHLRPDRGDQPRTRAGAAGYPASPLVSQHMELGAGPLPRAQITLGPEGPGFVALVTDDSAVESQAMIPRRLSARASHALRPAGRPAPLHRQRNKHAPRLRSRQPQPQAVRQGRVPPLRDPRRERASTPRRPAPRPPFSTGSTRSRPAEAWSFTCG